MSDTTDVHGPYGPTPTWPAPPPAATEPSRFRVRQRLARLGASRPPQTAVLDPLFAIALANHPKADLATIERAYQTAEFYHRSQVRKSGDAYITHPLAVATILAELGMTDTTICAGLLHDTVEDTGYTMAQLTADFGEEVAQLVDGVTKLDKVTYGEAAKAETIRKMVVAMAKDIRVLVIKLADRLHNMRTIGYLRPDKQSRISRETLEIFAPLAHRLGMNAIKWELEDLSFSTMQPKVYDEIVHLVAQRAPQRDEYLRRVITDVQEQLAQAKIKATVYGRPKHYYSIYQKMVVRGRDFSDIYDLIGLRVLVDSRADCYAALGVMHVHWNPLPGRFKDYIAMPKFNLYQSLHTTVLGPEAKPVELQIRTHSMHRTAEYGVAAHWKYKEGGKTTPVDLNWVNQLRDWQKESSDPGEFLDDLRFEISTDEVYAFTPKGEVFSLPSGSTPVDFAYSVHTQVGERCIGARVNGRLVPLDSALANGDVVEILTSKAEDAGPSRDWLAFVKSPRARNKIRRYFSKEQREESLEQGKDELAKQLRRQGLPMQRLLTVAHLTAVAESFHLKDIDSLYTAIGEGTVSAQAAVSRLISDEGGYDQAQADVLEDVPIVARSRNSKGDSGVEVDGDSSLFVKLAKCCTPVPGDEIIGWITRMNGVSVHRSDCSNVDDLMRQPERLVPVSWSGTSQSNYLVAIQVEGLDRAGMLADITRNLAEHKISITSLSMLATKDRIFRVKLTFETPDPTHLKNILANIRRIDGVYDVYRIGQ